MARKFLIAAGTGKYDHLPSDLQRPTLKTVVDSIATLFTEKLGYERVLLDVSTDPTSDEFRIRLDDWFGSNERNNSDWVVLYYTGHGELVGTDSLYLLTKDYVNGRLVGTAFSINQLGEMLIGTDAGGETRRVRRFLAIIDTCHAGAGAFDLSRKISKLFSQGSNYGMFYALAAAFPNEEALTGALANALIDSLQDESLGGAQQPLIFFDQLVPAINRRLNAHRVVYSPVVSPDVEPEFFPNPRYREGLPPSPTIAEIRGEEKFGNVRALGLPITSGMEIEVQRGSYFRGRVRLLTELADWLTNSTDNRIRVITGRPGTGKSAILSKIVTLSDPQYRQLMPQEDVRWAQVFPSQCIDMAIHAKGKTSREVMQAFAVNLGVVPEIAKIFETLNSREQPYHVVVDALDEAREPQAIAENLLAPLHLIPKVKVMVGMRPEYIEKLGTHVVRIYVDDLEYIEKDDVAQYVKARLLRSEEEGAATPYQGREALAGKVAIAVAEKAFPNFLIARLVAEDLLAVPDPLDEETIRRREFPATVAKAFEQFLARFGPEEKKARDLLTPLAWAEGKGLPWGNIWPILASALSDESYSDEDIRWLIERAGSFVIEALEQERSTYRLYHQALTDYLRHDSEKRKIQYRIVNALMGTLMNLAGLEERRDWRTAHPYIRSHLAEHAVACGMLRYLIADPLFLLAADPDRLLSVFSAHGNDVPAEIDLAYKGIFHLLKGNSINETAPYLEMIARKSRLTEFADQINLLPLDPAWSVPWANWMRVSTHRILASNEIGFYRLAVAKRRDKDVFVSGGINGDIGVWDLDKGDVLVAPMKGHTGFLTAVTIVEREGRSFIVTGDSDGVVRLWDLDQGLALGNSFIYNQHSRVQGSQGPSVAELATAERQGLTVIVCGYSDGTILVLGLDLALGISLVELTFHVPELKSLVVAKLQQRTVIVSGHSSGVILVSDLDHGHTLGNPLNGHRASVNDLAVTTHQGRTVIVSAGEDKTVRIWDLEEGRQLGNPFTYHADCVTALAVTERLGRTVIISGDLKGRILIWDLEDRRLLGEVFPGHTSVLRSLTVREVDGRTWLVSNDFESVRVWDLEQSSRTVSNAPTGHFVYASALAEAQRHGRTVIASGSYGGTIHTWDLEKGQEVGDPLIAHLGVVNGLMFAERQGRKVLISGGNDGTLRVWDLDQSLTERNPLIWHVGWIEALAVAKRESRTFLFCGGMDGTIRTWDLERGSFVGEPFGGHVGSVHAITTAELKGRTAVISGGSDGAIRIWDLDQGRALSGSPNRHTGVVTALLSADLGGQTVIISGDSDGHIRVWDLDQGSASRSLCAWDTAPVSALAVTERRGRTVVASGSSDGCVRFWDLVSQDHLRTINIGAPVLCLAYIPAPDLTLVVVSSMGLMPIQFHRL